jgi:hypothetical protein
VFGDSAVSTADCKQGYELFSEPGNAIIGCYKLFSDELTWTQAEQYCETEEGVLAAARSEAESDWLDSIASKRRYWIAAYSFTIGVSVLWSWYGYSLSARMSDPWITLQNLNYNTKANKVILAGRQGPYAWSYEDPNSVTAPFICRKQGTLWPVILLCVYKTVCTIYHPWHLASTLLLLFVLVT